MRACPFTLLLCAFVASVRSATPVLRFDKEGTFKLVQFTDMHYGENALFDRHTSALQSTVLQVEQPHFAVFSGDAVSGYAWPNQTKGWYESQWKHWTEPVTSAGTPYAYCLGNHDDQADLNRMEIVELDKTNPLSLTQVGPSDVQGVTNYHLDIMAAESDAVMAHIFFFDTMDDDCLGVKGWGCLYPDAVQWFSNTVKALEKKHGRRLPSIGFYHIPLDEMMNLYDSFETRGNKTEQICCSSVNTGLFAALVEAGSMQFISCGHDHNNDFVGKLDNITLAYGRKTGFGGYGPPTGWLRGSRVLELHLNTTSGELNFDTWIRQQDGSRMDQGPNKPQPDSKQNICGGAIGAPPSKCSVYEAEFRRSLMGRPPE